MNRTVSRREAYDRKRNPCTSIKRKAKVETRERLCDDFERDLEGNKKFIFHLAKS